MLTLCHKYTKVCAHRNTFMFQSYLPSEPLSILLGIMPDISSVRRTWRNNTSSIRIGGRSCCRQKVFGTYVHGPSDHPSYRHYCGRNRLVQSSVWWRNNFPGTGGFEEKTTLKCVNNFNTHIRRVQYASFFSDPIFTSLITFLNAMYFFSLIFVK